VGLSPDPTHGRAEASQALCGEGFDSLWMLQANDADSCSQTHGVGAAALAARMSNSAQRLSDALYQPTDLAHRIFSLMQMCGNR
jgi:hypothetical protein